MTGVGYQISNLIGRGGYGSVYRAEYHGTAGFSREVALKVLNPELESVERLAQRLRDEARILGQLSHRAIVYVDELVHLDGRWAMVMEFIEGADLRKLIALGPVPPGPALEIVAEVAGALATAYWTRSRYGAPLRMLHRDVKPSNILLTPHGEVKVVDFGVAFAEFDERESVSMGRRYGTVGYIAPERLDGRDGPEGDVYSLGAVFYELLSGRPLGRPEGGPAAHNRHVGRAIHELRTSLFDQNDEVLNLVSSMLVYDPDQRPTAGSVERRCKALRTDIKGSWLREWAEVHVPGLLGAPPIVGDDLEATEDDIAPFLTAESGEVLVETTDDEHSVPTLWPTNGPEVVIGVTTAPRVPQGIKSARPAPSRVHAQLGVGAEASVQGDHEPVIRKAGNPLFERPWLLALLASASAFVIVLAWLLLFH